MKISRIVSTLICMSLMLHSARAATPQNYEDVVNKFFNLIAAGKSADAVEYLYRTNPWSEKIPDALQQVKSSFASSDAMVGSYRGNSLVVKRVLGDRIVYLYYLVAYDRQPLKFEFYFDKPSDKWVLQNFAFNDKILDDVRDSARYEFGQSLK